MASKRLLAWLVASSAALGDQIPMPFGVHYAPNPVCDPATFSSLPDLGTGASITSIETHIQRDHASSKNMHRILPKEGLSFCEVQIHLNHDGSDDDVLVEVWLPLSREGWNGRYQATGGSVTGYSLFEIELGPAVSAGYAASSTDGGHAAIDAPWILKSDGKINWDLLHNFATRSTVEQVILGKSITEQFYGQKPRYSYWNGCSMGGRQGYMLAQRYPHLLDGILANAPAISLSHLLMADFWPQLVMKEEGLWMSSCEFNYFRQKAMESCDMLDSVSDGVISAFEICDFDPLHVVGQVFYCDDKPVEVTRAMANIVRRIEQGPRTPLNTPIWHGFIHGTSFDKVANTYTSSAGARVSNPLVLSRKYIQNFLLKDPSFNVTRLNYADYMALWAQSNAEFGWLLDADNPDLTSLKSAGTKLLTWHGINDPVIPYQSTVHYRKRVEMLMGGANEVDQFYRLFLAPGVEHCAKGNGPVPKDPLAALVEWVEEGTAPEMIEAATATYQGELVTRELCAWPGNAKYMGIGDAKRWSSWSCEGGTERPEESSDQEEDGDEPGRAGQILEGLKDRLGGLGMGLTIG